MWAATINSALRVAVEHHALNADAGKEDQVEAVRAALRIAAGGLPR